jgi:hypothetical protein
MDKEVQYVTMSNGEIDRSEPTLKALMKKVMKDVQDVRVGNSVEVYRIEKVAVVPGEYVKVERQGPPTARKEFLRRNLARMALNMFDNELAFDSMRDGLPDDVVNINKPKRWEDEPKVDDRVKAVIKEMYPAHG